jgi:GntR family transcriptional regulator, transcriptional repressor for pyruvate dehydrogenase complex
LTAVALSLEQEELVAMVTRLVDGVATGSPHAGEAVPFAAEVEEQADAVGDVPRTLRIVDRFHETIVVGCGNETMVLMVGALERVWAGHASAVYDSDQVDEPTPSVWKASLREHQRLLAAIERGEPRVGELALKHLEATHAYMSTVDERRMVTAALTAAHST